MNCILINCLTLDVKSGQIRDRVRNSGQFSVLNDFVFFSGQALKIRDCPEKFGTNGHLSTASIAFPGFGPSAQPVCIPVLSAGPMLDFIVNVNLRASCGIGSGVLKRDPVAIPLF